MRKRNKTKFNPEGIWGVATFAVMATMVTFPLTAAVKESTTAAVFFGGTLVLLLIGLYISILQMLGKLK